MLRRVIPLLFLLISCGSPQSHSSLTGLGASGSGKNVAILMGSPNGLAGVATDIREMSALLSQEDFHFRVVSDSSASTGDIFSAVTAEAADADSIFWYFSGHGNNGIMAATDRSFAFREVADKIKEARNGKPLERLIVVIDSCLSGSFVDGNSAIITEPDAETGSHSLLAEKLYEPLEDSSLYKQAFVFSAAKKNENSLDLGSSRGGAFTYIFRTVMGRLSAAVW